MADERCQGILHLHAPAPGGGEVGLVAGEFGALALHVEFARETGLETFLGDAERVAAALDRRLDDAHHRVGRTQVVVHDGDVGRHDEIDVGRVGLRCLPLRARGGVGTAHAPKKVNLPVQVHRQPKQAVRACQWLLGEGGRSAASGRASRRTEKGAGV